MSTDPLEITVLGATGATGFEIARQALDRGHSVIAIARRPERLQLPESERLIRRAADVTDRVGIAEALRGSSLVLSGLGTVRGESSHVLLHGAQAVVAAQPRLVVWLGAFGTGPSAEAAGPVTRAFLRLFLGSELRDKVAADALILANGGSLVHAGPLSHGALSLQRRVVDLEHAPKRVLPASVSRSTVAAIMLDAAEQATSGIIVPLTR